MATSPVEICNLALSWLAGNRIISLEDEVKEAELCKANYVPSRRAVLEEHEWTFAIKRVELPSVAEPPLFEYAYKFLVPSDLIFSIGVYDPARVSGLTRGSPPQTKHVKEEKHFLADIPTIYCKYVAEVTNTTEHSPLFDQTLAAHIGMNIAVPLTENDDHFIRMAKLYGSNLDRASASDSMQGTREYIEKSEQENSRRMFTGIG